MPFPGARRSVVPRVRAAPVQGPQLFASFRRGTSPRCNPLGYAENPPPSTRAIRTSMHSFQRTRAARAAVAITIASLPVLHSTACGVGPIPVSDSPRDPSNPKAPEGVSPAVATSAHASPSTAAPAGHDHGGHAATSSAAPGAVHAMHDASAGQERKETGDAGIVYACPMHPEVTSSSPGACPKCNMKLVPRK